MRILRNFSPLKMQHTLAKLIFTLVSFLFIGSAANANVYFKCTNQNHRTDTFRGEILTSFGHSWIEIYDPQTNVYTPITEAEHPYFRVHADKLNFDLGIDSNTSLYSIIPISLGQLVVPRDLILPFEAQRVKLSEPNSGVYYAVYFDCVEMRLKKK